MAPPAEKQRTFASWGTQDPQLHTDQYIVWTGENGLVERFDSTGRAVAPFILARVVFEDHRDVEGFQLPGQVTVFEAGEAGSVVHAWRVVDVRLGPPRSR